MSNTIDQQGRTEAEFLADYDLTKYPAVGVTVDTVLLTIRQGQLSILLIKRAGHPFIDEWALPGGFKDPGESLETAAVRELGEETGLDMAAFTGAGHLEQLGAYGDPGRDPRGHIVSIAYVAFIPELPLPVSGSDAAAARWWPVADLGIEQLGFAVDGDSPCLAFDHATIIVDGVERARAKLEYSTLAAAFVEEPFTVSDLRRVYEAVWGENLNYGNFWRKVTRTDGFLVPTGAERPTGKGNPAALYRRGEARWISPPLMRSET